MYTIQYTENSINKTFKTYAIDLTHAVECFWDCMADESPYNAVINLLSVKAE